MKTSEFQTLFSDRRYFNDKERFFFVMDPYDNAVKFTFAIVV